MRSSDLRHVFQRVFAVALLAPPMALACGETADTTNDGGTANDGGATTGDGGTTSDGGLCPPGATPFWQTAGCGASAPTPKCVTEIPACYGVACSCAGKVISGCLGFPEPWSKGLPLGPDENPVVGSPCGEADAGCVDPPQPAADAGSGCAPWSVPLPCAYPKDGGASAVECEAWCGGNSTHCSPLEENGKTVLRCDPGCAIGRRPEGFKLQSSRTGEEATIAGEYFAAMAELEAASVFAFERLERELAAHAAPNDLRRRARSAAEDERRHARVAGALAKRFGRDASAPTAPAMTVRDLRSMALENAVEGCVRETFGALVATLQAERATDPRVRAAMRKIAIDETAHAGLAWSVASWLDGMLSEEERARVRTAMREAVHELREETRVAQAKRVEEVAGLPSTEEAVRMVDQLVAELWAA